MTVIDAPPATEIGVVHIRLGRNAFSFTLHEAILVAAALVASPADLGVDGF